MANRSRVVVVPAIVDLALVLLFVAIGRGTHRESVDLLGMLETSWPFVVALALGWSVTRAWRKPRGVLRPGVGIWIVTVAAAMMLRFVAGFGTAPSFIVVTAVALAVLLLGWRALTLVFRPASSVSG